MRYLLKILSRRLLHVGVGHLWLRMLHLVVQSLRLRVGMLHLKVRALVLELRMLHLHRWASHVRRSKELTRLRYARPIVAS
jgi:hypothetical protein